MTEITVLMPVFNGARHVGKAVESILRQTHGNFDLLVIDDGSSDGTPAILSSIRDQRLSVIRNSENRGITVCLHEGVARIQSPYIARMDADDIAHPQRLVRQVAFMKRHPNLVLVGSSCRLIDASGHVLRLHHVPAHDTDIRWELLFSNPFIHPSVMLQTATLHKHGLNYDLSFRTAQDYDLWGRLLQHGPGANLADTLIDYRVGEGITHRRRRDQLECNDDIALRMLMAETPELKIDRHALTQLRSLLWAGWSVQGTPPAERLHLLHLYLNVFDAFSRHHAGDARLHALRNKVAIASLRILLLTPPWHANAGAAWKRLYISTFSVARGSSGTHESR